MHCLETIIRQNAEAAGREAGHAANDGDNQKVADIAAQFPREGKLGPGYLMVLAKRAAFLHGYAAGRREG